MAKPVHPKHHLKLYTDSDAMKLVLAWLFVALPLGLRK